ncbi:MAG TPA: MBL fold metallo-hydrolase, partial [Leptospiraceae bacterium]|nr:MBL fold metallo-hydrolase [Leptospiraceae bacterium]
MRTVVTIDCQYLYPLTACAYMICEKDRVAFVENNTAHAVPLLLSALAEHGYSPEQVEYAIITHVHLD